MKAIIPIIFFSLIFFSSFGQKADLVIFSETGEQFYIILNSEKQNNTAKGNVKVNELALGVYKMKIQFENEHIPEIKKTVYLDSEGLHTFEVKQNKNGKFVARDLSLDLSMQNVVLNPSTTSSRSTSYNPNHQNNTQCSPIVSESAFRSTLTHIKAQNFPEKMTETAKQITRTSCFSANQIKRIIEVFKFEHNRLDYAKFAYPYCADPINYQEVNDAFQFLHSKNELNEYIGRK